MKYQTASKRWIEHNGEWYVEEGVLVLRGGSTDGAYRFKDGSTSPKYVDLLLAPGEWLRVRGD